MDWGWIEQRENEVVVFPLAPSSLSESLPRIRSLDDGVLKVFGILLAVDRGVSGFWMH